MLKTASGIPRLFSFSIAVLFFVGILSSCTNEKTDRSSSLPLFTLLDSSQTGIHFSNTLNERKDFNILFFDYFYNGAGVAIGDIDNDGLQDILLTANTGPNRLFLNKGDLQFKDITKESGLLDFGRWSTGAVMIDINNDGWLDIYICNAGPHMAPDSLRNELYINQKDGTFRESAALYGIDGMHRSTQASFFDYDQDGDLDLFVMNYSDIVFQVHDLDKKVSSYNEETLPLNSSVLYRNDGNGSFTDVTRDAGLLRACFGLGLITSDLNGDGLVDIYVSNDYVVPNYMFINQGDGTFRDETKERLEHCSHFSMGTDFGDINNDGLGDIVELDMMPEDHVLSKTFMRPMNADLFFEITRKGVIPQFMYNSLHIQHGFGIFSEIAQMAGVGKTDWSWAALLADADNDGWNDLFVTNGFRRNLKNNDYIQSQYPQVAEWVQEGNYDSSFAFLKKYPGYPLVNYFYQNNQDLSFTNKASEWGFDQASYSNGAAYADLDNDGDLDLIINNIDQQASLYRNNASSNNENKWLQFELVDSESGQIPFNTKVFLELKDGSRLMNELRTTRGFQSSVEPILHFGLGKDPGIRSVRLEWPDKTVTEMDAPQLNKRHLLDKQKLVSKPSQLVNRLQFIWKDVSTTLFREVFKHEEDNYHDFHKEILLPYKQSNLGPYLSAGDVNADGYEDFFIGGAKGQSGRLYLMDPDRGFYTAPCQPWKDQAEQEDMGSAFVDVDGDGDLDLYIVSGGGGAFSEDLKMLQDRLYLNQGNGCFSGPHKDMLPEVRSSGGRVIAGDFTGDGRPDLFVCGRTAPGAYPSPVRSYLLENNGSGFSDITESWAPWLDTAGMVTDARFHDFNGDGKQDLVIASEWMNLRILIQEEGQFIDRSSEWGLQDKRGWWYSLTLADLNQDGRTDIVAGNLGVNNKFKINEDHPLHIFASDFDENGTLDIVLSSKYKESLVPVRGRECSSQQMPFIKNKFPTFSQFAQASLDDIYGVEKLGSALHYQANEAMSIVWLNNGSSFDPIPLPKPAQMGPILSCLTGDYNNDGIVDLLIAGDLPDTEPETPAFDGSRGMMLTGNGDGTFTPVWLNESGFYLRSNSTRELITVKPGNFPGKLVIAASNNDYLQALHFQGQVGPR